MPSAPRSARKRAPSAVATLPAIISKSPKRFRNSRHGAFHDDGVAVRDVDDDDVHAGAHEFGGALEIVARGADRRADAQPARDRRASRTACAAGAAGPSQSRGRAGRRRSSTSGSFLTLRSTMIRSASAEIERTPVHDERDRAASCDRRRDAGPARRTACRAPSAAPAAGDRSSTTTSVPTRERAMRAAASAGSQWRRRCTGSVMTPCCVRLTISTSRTCGSISPGRNPRSMIPIPPSSACTIAIGARVTVSMFAETIGRLSVMARESRQDRSIAAGSRRSRTLR